MSLRLSAGWLASAALLGALGCRQLLAIEEREATRGEGSEPSACPNVFVSPTTEECIACLRGLCCKELSGCDEDPECLPCTQGADSCTHPDSFSDLESCVNGSCAAACAASADAPKLVGEPYCSVPLFETFDGECVTLGKFFGRVHCNPLTNVPCGMDVCAPDANFVFDCRTVGHHRRLCQTCGLVDGLCASGLVCTPDEGSDPEWFCTHWCCSDDDCNHGAGLCAPLQLPEIEQLGICIAKTP